MCLEFGANSSNPKIQPQQWWRWCNGGGNVLLALFELVNTKHPLKVTAYLSFVADFVKPF